MNQKLFKNLRVGEHFSFGHARWVKRTSRTAHLASNNFRKFYFSKNEVCSVQVIKECRV